jgi:hypothetical protein
MKGISEGIVGINNEEGIRKPIQVADRSIVATAVRKGNQFERPSFTTCNRAVEYMLQASSARELPSPWSY